MRTVYSRLNLREQKTSTVGRMFIGHRTRRAWDGQDKKSSWECGLGDRWITPKDVLQPLHQCPQWTPRNNDYHGVLSGRPDGPGPSLER